jgi:hypothetical protein
MGKNPAAQIWGKGIATAAIEKQKEIIRVNSGALFLFTFSVSAVTAVAIPARS